MKIGILGTGTVAQTIGKKLIELGHEIMLGSRTSNNEKAMAFIAELKTDMAKTGTFEEASSFGELAFNCVKGEFTLDVVKKCMTALEGKILIDLSNPLDFSRGMPPGLVPELSNFNSLGETIQKELPNSKVVKTFNTMWCGIMVNPSMIGNGDHVNFISGNDDQAKSEVKKLLHEIGWKDSSIIDLGDITAARGTEAYLPLWLRMYGAGKSGAFNISVVR